MIERPMVRLSLFLLCVLWQTANGYEWLPNRSIRPHSYTYRSALHTQAGSFSLKGSINSENLLVKIEGTDRDGDGKVGNNVNNNSIESSQNEMKEMSSWFARGLLIFVSALYGTNFGIVKILETNLDAGIAAASRFTLAAAIFAPALYRLIKIKPELIKGGLEVGAYCSIAYWGQANALETTSSSTAAFICSLAVVVVPILESLFGQKDVIKSKQEKLTLFLPAALAVAGVGCLELGGSQMPQVGDAWALLQPIFFGMGFWRAEKHMRMATQAGDAQAFTGAMMLFIAAFSWVWATNDNILPLLNFADSTQVNSDRVMGMLQQQGSAMMDWHVIAALLWTGLVTTAFTSFVENIAMKKLDAVESTVIYSTEPLWGTLFAATFLGEAIGTNTYIGALLIISACVYRTADVGAIIAALSSAQLGTGDYLEELGENTGANIQNLFSSIMDSNIDNILDS